MAKAIEITAFARTPSSRAMRKSSDAARIWMPQRDFFRNSPRAASRASDTAMVTMSILGIVSPAKAICSVSPRPMSTALGRPP